MNAIANSSFFSILQIVVPFDMQGRVFTLVMATSSGIAPIGLAIAGPVAEIVGIRFWFMIAGLSILIGSLMGFLIPGLRDFEKKLQTEKT
jgi:DHA3 family macrolide efflux protein-like MFS transporter